MPPPPRFPRREYTSGVCRTCTHVYTHTSGPCSEGEIKKHHRACHTYSTLPWNIFLPSLALSLFFFAFYPHLRRPCNPTYYSAVERAYFNNDDTFAVVAFYLRSFSFVSPFPFFNGFFAHSYIDCLCSPDASPHSPGSLSFDVHNQLNARLLLFFFLSSFQNSR